MLWARVIAAVRLSLFVRRVPGAGDKVLVHAAAEVPGVARAVLRPHEVEVGAGVGSAAPVTLLTLPVGVSVPASRVAVVSNAAARVSRVGGVGGVDGEAAALDVSLAASADAPALTLRFALGAALRAPAGAESAFLSQTTHARLDGLRESAHALEFILSATGMRARTETADGAGQTSGVPAPADLARQVRVLDDLFCALQERCKAPANLSRFMAPGGELAHAGEEFDLVNSQALAVVPVFGAVRELRAARAEFDAIARHGCGGAEQARALMQEVAGSAAAAVRRRLAPLLRMRGLLGARLRESRTEGSHVFTQHIYTLLLACDSVMRTLMHEALGVPAAQTVGRRQQQMYLMAIRKSLAAPHAPGDAVSPWQAQQLEHVMSDLAAQIAPCKTASEPAVVAGGGNTLRSLTAVVLVARVVLEAEVAHADRNALPVATSFDFTFKRRRCDGVASFERSWALLSTHPPAQAHAALWLSRLLSMDSERRVVPPELHTLAQQAVFGQVTPDDSDMIASIFTEELRPLVRLALYGEQRGSVFAFLSKDDVHHYNAQERVRVGMELLFRRALAMSKAVRSVPARRPEREPRGRSKVWNCKREKARVQ